MNRMYIAIKRYWIFSGLILLIYATRVFITNSTLESHSIMILFAATVVLSYVVFGLYMYPMKKSYRQLYRGHKRLIDNANEAIAFHKVLWGEDGTGIVNYEFISVNRAFELTTGLKSEEIVGKRVLDVLPETEDYWLEAYGKVVINQESITFINYAEAVEKYFKVTAYPVGKDKFATVFLDISEKLKSDKVIKQTMKKAEKASTFKTQFLKDVNHKLRTPLNGMMGMAQLMAMEEMSTELRGMFDIMIAEMYHSRNILNQIAEYIDLKDENYQITENDILADIEQIRTEAASGVEITLELERDEATYRSIYYEKQVFNKVITTLISNAVKHSDSSFASITIVKDLLAVEMIDYLSIELKDYGIGLEEKQMEVLFNEMHHDDFVNIYREQGHMSLPLCRELMKHIGGDLTCRSSEEEGAVFCIKLPVFGRIGE